MSDTSLLGALAEINATVPLPFGYTLDGADPYGATTVEPHYCCIPNLVCYHSVCVEDWTSHYD